MLVRCQSRLCPMTWLNHQPRQESKAKDFCRLIADEGFRKDLVSRIAKTGVAIEDALGSAQDIEGAVEEDGSITVVQTRPQM